MSKHKRNTTKKQSSIAYLSYFPSTEQGRHFTKECIWPRIVQIRIDDTFEQRNKLKPTPDGANVCLSFPFYATGRHSVETDRQTHRQAATVRAKQSSHSQLNIQREKTRCPVRSPVCLISRETNGAGLLHKIYFETPEGLRFFITGLCRLAQHNIVNRI